MGNCSLLLVYQVDGRYNSSINAIFTRYIGEFPYFSGCLPIAAQVEGKHGQ